MRTSNLTLLKQRGSIGEMQGRERCPQVSDQRQKDLVALFHSLLDNW